MIEFFVPGDPQPMAKKLISGKRIYARDPGGRKKAWAELVHLKAKLHTDKMIPAMEAVMIQYYFFRVKPKSNKTDQPVQRPDIDNYAYLVTNALSGVCYEDDCQIINSFARLQWADDDNPPGVLIRVDKWEHK